MNKWFYFNIAVLLIAGWKITQRYFLTDIPIHILVGLIGLIFILFNWTRHAVFSTIRTTPERAKKIKFANLSKKVLPFHRWIGTAALLIILIHATLVIHLFGFHWGNVKQVSGLVTGFILLNMVITGWMRRIRPSKNKRMAHIYLGLTMFFLIVIHVIM